ncbi:PEP/pyruvate-binding domain-containing protein [Paenibacillus faecalis]|uniref:PEP/pyruvate-binding domain-containing protein n=1 Tax=Paenibacillus faecalis TaxID=2079532 RepID=UPI000D0F9144|nr:PEP/pyruvate-binding domain-containing protein [Paenibacillus faecalis]
MKNRKMTTKNIQYYRAFRCKSKLLSIEAEFTGIVNHRGHIVGCENTNALAKSIEDTWDVFYDIHETENAGVIGYNFVKQKGFLNDYIQKSYNSGMEYRKFGESLDLQSFEQLSNSELYNLFNEYFNLYSKCLAYYRFTNEEFTNKIQSRIKMEFNDNNYNQELQQQILTHDLKGTMINQQEEDWNKLIHISSNEGLEELITEHSRKYAFLFGDNGNNLNQVIDIFKSRFNRDQGQKIERNKTTNEEKIDISSSFSGEFIDLIQATKRLSKHRLQLREMFMLGNFFVTSLLSGIYIRMFKKRIVDKSLLRLVSSQDIMNYFEHNREIDINVMYNRKLGLNCFLTNDYIYIWDNILKRNTDSNDVSRKSENTIIGEVACSKGLVEGIAVCLTSDIIQNLRELPQVIENKIIVSSSIHPNIITSGAHIKGIITNEGGILSHASIIARELGVPCIIGTRNATERITDGDWIKMDSDIGMIEILTDKKLGRKNVINYYLSNLVIPLDKAKMEIPLAVGNKAHNLSKYFAEFSVPDGICLTQQFCKDISKWDDMVGKFNESLIKEWCNNGDTSNLLKQIGEWFEDQKKKNILATELLQELNGLYPLIVRSSSVDEDTLSFSNAGMLESIKNIYDSNRLLDAIYEVITSAFTLSHLNYRQLKGLSIMPECPSVLIQKQVNTQITGVTFSVNPKSQSSDVVVINYGCGELGTEEKSRTLYVMKESMQLISEEGAASTREIELSRNQMKELVQMAIMIEKNEGNPVDIEWCYDLKGNLHLLQVRPISLPNNKTLIGVNDVTIESEKKILCIGPDDWVIISKETGFETKFNPQEITENLINRDLRKMKGS